MTTSLDPSALVNFKIFCIGANKTGSTSMEQLLIDLGLNVGPQRHGELTTADISKGDYSSLFAYVYQYTAFQDVPFAVKSVYVALDALFPRSKFILTIRDPEDWFTSFLSHHKRALKTGDRVPTLRDFSGHDYLYEGFRQLKFEWDWLIKVDPQTLQSSTDWALAFDKQHFINLYNQRNLDVIRHFHGRKDLLVVDITKEKTTEKIVRFLGLPAECITEMPHLNKGS